MEPTSPSARNAALLAKTKIPLRERKLAQTRLALLEELEAKPLADVRARDLCERVGISEATFFNHFASKSELLLYFVLLWSVEMGCLSRALAR